MIQFDTTTEMSYITYNRFPLPLSGWQHLHPELNKEQEISTCLLDITQELGQLRSVEYTFPLVIEEEFRVN